jgi:hypothetical protein
MPTSVLGLGRTLAVLRDRCRRTDDRTAARKCRGLMVTSVVTSPKNMPLTCEKTPTRSSDLLPPRKGYI